MSTEIINSFLVRTCVVLLCFTTISCLGGKQVEEDLQTHLTSSEERESSLTTPACTVQDQDTVALHTEQCQTKDTQSTITVTIVNMAGIKQASVELNKAAYERLQFEDLLKLCTTSEMGIDFKHLQFRAFEDAQKKVWVSNASILRGIALSFVTADSLLLLPDTCIKTLRNDENAITLTVVKERCPKIIKPPPACCLHHHPQDSPYTFGCMACDRTRGFCFKGRRSNMPPGFP